MSEEFVGGVAKAVFTLASKINELIDDIDELRGRIAALESIHSGFGEVPNNPPEAPDEIP